MQVSVPVLEQNIEQAGLSHVHAANVAVLDLETDPTAAATRVVEVALKAETEDKIDAVILGCGGMVNVTRTIRSTLSVPVLDPVEMAAKSMRWFV